MIKISRNSLNRLIESFLISEVGTNYQEGLRMFTEKLNQYMEKIEDKDKSSGGKLEDLYKMMSAVVDGVQKDKTKKGDPELLKKMKKLSDAAVKERDTARFRIKRKYADLLDDIARDATSLHQQYVASNPDAFEGEMTALGDKFGEIVSQQRQAAKKKAETEFDTDIDMSGYTKDTKKGSELHAQKFLKHTRMAIQKLKDTKNSSSLIQKLKESIDILINAKRGGVKDEKTKNDLLTRFRKAYRDATIEFEKIIKENQSLSQIGETYVRLANSTYRHMETLKSFEIFLQGLEENPVSDYKSYKGLPEEYIKMLSTIKSGKVYKQGNTGDDVASLQRAIKKAIEKEGLKDDSAAKAYIQQSKFDDGNYGAKTTAAVKALQKKLNIDVDGKVGKQTIAAILQSAMPREYNYTSYEGANYLDRENRRKGEKIGVGKTLEESINLSRWKKLSGL